MIYFFVFLSCSFFSLVQAGQGDGIPATEESPATASAAAPVPKRPVQRGAGKKKELTPEQRERKRAYDRKWRARHPEKQREKSRKSMAKYRARHPEKAREQNRKSIAAYRARHAEKEKERRSHPRYRLLDKLGSDIRKLEQATLKEQYEGRKAAAIKDLRILHKRLLDTPEDSENMDQILQSMREKRAEIGKTVGKKWRVEKNAQHNATASFDTDQNSLRMNWQADILPMDGKNLSDDEEEDGWGTTDLEVDFQPVDTRGRELLELSDEEESTSESALSFDEIPATASAAAPVPKRPVQRGAGKKKELTPEQREKRRKWVAEYRARHPEKAREQTRKSLAAYRARHPEKEKERKSHPRYRLLQWLGSDIRSLKKAMLKEQYEGRKADAIKDLKILHKRLRDTPKDSENIDQILQDVGEKRREIGKTIGKTWRGAP